MFVTAKTFSLSNEGTEILILKIGVTQSIITL